MKQFWPKENKAGNAWNSKQIKKKFLGFLIPSVRGSFFIKGAMDLDQALTGEKAGVRQKPLR